MVTECNYCYFLRIHLYTQTRCTTMLGGQLLVLTLDVGYNIKGFGSLYREKCFNSKVENEHFLVSLKRDKIWF